MRPGHRLLNREPLMVIARTAAAMSTRLRVKARRGPASETAAEFPRLTIAQSIPIHRDKSGAAISIGWCHHSGDAFRSGVTRSQSS